MNKKICWITATYFLDVDLPIVPNLQKEFDIDWYIITNEKNEKQDEEYVRSKDCKSYEILVDNNLFFGFPEYRFLKNFIRRIKKGNYDWYYFDISSYLFLYQFVKKYIGVSRVTIATHNVKTPKGARFYCLAKRMMNYIVRNFRHFQVFSKNQQKFLYSLKPDADIFYCPLMLKDYGKIPEINRKKDKISFLFFGNIIDYKRVDILINAAEILYSRGFDNFKIKIAGNCRPEVWKSKYQILIKHPEIFTCDIRRIPNNMVSQYFGESDYFVMPYQDIAQSGAMTVAFNYNLPIIASDLDTFKEFMTDNQDGFFFKSLDVFALAEIMQRALYLPHNEYERLKENQRTHIKNNLSEKVVLTKYINYLNDKLND